MRINKPSHQRGYLRKRILLALPSTLMFAIFIEISPVAEQNDPPAPKASESTYEINDENVSTICDYNNF